MAENHRNHENDELGRLDASDAKDRKILLTVLLINLTQSAAGIALGIWAVYGADGRRVGQPRRCVGLCG